MKDTIQEHDRGADAISISGTKQVLFGKKGTAAEETAVHPAAGRFRDAGEYLVDCRRIPAERCRESFGY